MVDQSVPADSVSRLRESALPAAGVRGIFTNLIDGKSVGARNTLDVLDPATGELLAKVPDIKRDGMDAAFAAARRAFSSWSNLTWEARRSILEKALENVKAHREDLVTLLMAEGGRPRSLALWEVATVLDDFAPGVLAQSLRDVETTQPGVGRVTRHYAPLGVVAAISPWNLPLLLSYDKVVPALIAGNTVVLKPSFYTPLTVLRVAELVRDILPAGILNVVTGGDNIGPWMTSPPEVDKISYTGSTQTGRRVFESASQTLKHLTLELGGNDAGIVLPDVDVDAAIAPIFWGMFLVNGQGCITIKRLLVHESRYDEVAAALSKFAAEQVLGDGFDPATTIGPIQNRAQLLPSHDPRQPIPPSRLREARKLRSSKVADQVQHHRRGDRDRQFHGLRAWGIGLGPRPGRAGRGRSSNGSRDRLDQPALGRKSERAVRRPQGLGLWRAVRRRRPEGILLLARDFSQDLRSISAIWRELQPSYRFTPTSNPALFQPSLAPAIEAAGRSTRRKPNDLSVRYLRLHRSGSRQRRLRRGQPFGQRPWGDGVALGGRAARRQYADPHAR